MSDAVAISIVSAIGSFMAAVLGILNTWLVNELKKNTDGMKDQLVKVTRADAFKDGVKVGKEHSSQKPD